MKLETVDNPGWLLVVELHDTPLEHRAFMTIASRISETDWIHCTIKFDFVHK